MKDDPAPRILDYLRSRQEDMVVLLWRLVEAESPSVDPRAQRVVQKVLTEEFVARDFSVRHEEGRTSGGQLFVWPRDRPLKRPIQVMLGHSDTVWPVGSLERMPLHLHDGKLYGPGAYDMKGGLVQVVFALEALRALDLTPPVTPVALITSDEEVGSEDSFRYIRLLARVADRAFVMEPPYGPLGKLKTARKGNGKFEIQVVGKAAHAGLEPEKGASAILELSLVIQRLFRLSRPDTGVSVNVGTIDGGLRPNVIAPTSHATVDVRVLNPEDAIWIEKLILGMEAQTPGTRLEVSGGMNRLPMVRTPRNQRLWMLAQRAGTRLGLDLEDETAGGGSDGNITSLHTATLDGLGPVGDGAHADHENVVIASLPERAALLALLLLERPLMLGHAFNDGEAGAALARLGGVTSPSS